MDRRVRYKEALDFFVEQIRAQYPAAVVEVMPDEPPGGFTFWAEAYVPGRSMRGARRKIWDIEDTVHERYGVSLLTFVRSLNGRKAA